MSEDQNSVPAPEPVEAPKPTRRKAPARSPRKKAAPAPDAGPAVDQLPAGDASVAAPAPEAAVPGAEPAPKAKRAPRKSRAKAKAVPDEATAAVAAQDEEGMLPPEAPVRIRDEGDLPVAPPVLEVPVAVEAPIQTTVEAPVPDEGPARRKRKRRRGKGDRERVAGSPDAVETLAAELSEPAPVPEVPAAVAEEESVPQARVEPEVLPPLTVVGLGLDNPPALSVAALDALRAARCILGTADALDRLAGLGLEAPQRLCAADALQLEARTAGHAGSVLVVVGDGAGDGPALELLAELGPAGVRVLPGVGRVQAACAALGLSAEIVTVVDLRRAPLAALRGQLRAHRLLAVPVADAGRPLAVARLLLESGFPGARVWVCEFPGATLRAKAWLASELADLRDAIDAHAVLIIATGPSSGHFAELPGLPDAALGDEASAALPLAARVLALAWLQPAAWENGWAISDGEASLALDWARAVPTARVRAVGVDPTLLGVTMARAGVGENLAAVASATPARCAEWPAPEAVFIRGGTGLPEWLAAIWARLAPGGRLVASAEDDQARADLLAFAAQVPAEAWQELNLAHGETVGGRLRFTPAAPVRLALWRKPLPAGIA